MSNSKALAGFTAHRIPTPGSGPYILTEGPDGAIWFCESGAGKIGRLDVQTGRMDEFALADPASSPIGIIAGADGCLWFTQKKANRIGRITLDGRIDEFAVPTPLRWDPTARSGSPKPTPTKSAGSTRQAASRNFPKE